MGVTTPSLATLETTPWSLWAIPMRVIRQVMSVGQTGQNAFDSGSEKEKQAAIEEEKKESIRNQVKAIFI